MPLELLNWKAQDAQGTLQVVVAFLQKRSCLHVVDWHRRMSRIRHKRLAAVGVAATVGLLCVAKLLLGRPAPTGAPVSPAIGWGCNRRSQGRQAATPLSALLQAAACHAGRAVGCSRQLAQPLLGSSSGRCPSSCYPRCPRKPPAWHLPS